MKVVAFVSDRRSFYLKGICMRFNFVVLACICITFSGSSHAMHRRHVQAAHGHTHGHIPKDPGRAPIEVTYHEECGPSGGATHKGGKGGQGGGYYGDGYGPGFPGASSGPFEKDAAGEFVVRSQIEAERIFSHYERTTKLDNKVAKYHHLVKEAYEEGAYESAKQLSQSAKNAFEDLKRSREDFERSKGQGGIEFKADLSGDALKRENRAKQSLEDIERTMGQDWSEKVARRTAYFKHKNEGMCCDCADHAAEDSLKPKSTPNKSSGSNSRGTSTAGKGTGKGQGSASRDTLTENKGIKSDGVAHGIATSSSRGAGTGTGAGTGAGESSKDSKIVSLPNAREVFDSDSSDEEMPTSRWRAPPISFSVDGHSVSISNEEISAEIDIFKVVQSLANLSSQYSDYRAKQQALEYLGRVQDAERVTDRRETRRRERENIDSSPQLSQNTSDRRISEQLKIKEPLETKVSKLQERSNRVNEQLKYRYTSIQLSSDAKQYIKSEVTRSLENGRNALKQANNPDSKALSELVINYSLSKVEAFEDFLEGLQNGFFKGVYKTADVMKAVASNPELLANIPEHFLQLIEDAPNFAKYAQDALIKFVNASALEQGEMLGELVSDIVQTALLAEVSGPFGVALKPALQEMGLFLKGTAGNAVSVGIIKGIQESSLFSSKFRSIEKGVWESVGYSEHAVFGGASCEVASSSGTALAQTVSNLENSRIRELINISKRIIKGDVGPATIVKDSARHIRIVTPHGDAVQATTRDALLARTQVAEGRSVYRIGMKGQSNTGRGAQFWSLEHPLTTPNFGQKYGIPEANLTNIDFVETGIVRRDVPFITRPAPGVGGNLGGGIEIVVPQNSGAITIENHVSL